jgi:hypothetical protein
MLVVFPTCENISFPFSVTGLSKNKAVVTNYKSGMIKLE